MKLPPRIVGALFLLALLMPAAFASAYNGSPKLIVVRVIDQFRADYRERYRDQLGRGAAPDTELGRRYLHSYSPEAGWYVMGVPTPFSVGTSKGTDHATPFSYDTHVPLAFYGLAFQPGVYRTHAEPVDVAVTLASLLGINAPAQATGRVLTEALQPPRKTTAPAGGTR